jgi:hypothetical protein
MIMTSAQLYVILIIISLCCGVTWYVKDKFDEAAQLVALQAQEKANNEKYVQLQKQSQTTETNRTKDQATIQQLTEKMRLSDEKAHTVCTLSINDQQLLKTATSRHSVSR